jgi:aldose 1-epimerase
MKTILLLEVALALAANAADYSARQTTRDGVDVVALADSARHTEVTILPSIGNMAYEMKVNGKDVLRAPSGSLAEFKAKPGMAGIPLLWPWANRIDQNSYYVNGKLYAFNLELGNVRLDANKKPIHGLLSNSSAWKVVSCKADRQAAEVTSRLEFWKYPDLMEQFPFAHTIEMTYRLKEGVLQVETVLRNHAVEPMPVAIGFHSFYKVNDAPPDQWKIHLGAREQLVLNSETIPTGERISVQSKYPDPLPLKGVKFDDVFTNMMRDANGLGEFWIQGKTEKVSVIYGPKYDVAVVVAAEGRDFVVMEAMSAITNAFNLAHRGVYKDLQMVAPDGEWRESFWVRPSGF